MKIDIDAIETLETNVAVHGSAPSAMQLQKGWPTFIGEIG